MIKEIKCYTLLCDNCGADVNEDEEFSCYADIEFSIEIAGQKDWVEHEGKWYCNDCHYYDDEDEDKLIIVRTKEVK